MASSSSLVSTATVSSEVALPSSPQRYLRLAIAVHTYSYVEMSEEMKESPKLISQQARDVTDPFLSQFIQSFERLLWARRFEQMDMTPPEPTDRIEDTYLLPICTLMNTHALRFGSPDLECVAFTAKDGTPASYMFGIGLSSGGPDTNWRKVSDPLPEDWSKVHQAFCVTSFMPPGTMKPDYFELHASDYVLHLPETIIRMVDDLRDLARDYNAPYGILTDEVSSVVFKIRHHRLRNGLDPLYCQAVPVEEHPVRYLLGALIHGIGCPQGLYADGLWPTLRRGAFPRTVPTVRDLDDAINNRHAFQDWDQYVLQYSREEWELFKEWKSTLAGQARLRPIRTGDILVCSGSHVRRSGDNSFSQVFYGTLNESEAKLCLKLYDERFFPLDREANSHESPWGSINSADGLESVIEVAQKEEAAYDRLCNSQGSLIPHYYRIYLFQLPDGARAWGLLMEVIDAPSLLEANAKSWPKDVQVDFVLRMRHAFRALRYAGVGHGDEHPRNVLCPQIRQAPHNAPEIVIVDFGRAELWLEDSGGTPASYTGSWSLVGFGGVLRAAGIDDEVLYRYWEPIQDEER